MRATGNVVAGVRGFTKHGLPTRPALKFQIGLNFPRALLSDLPRDLAPAFA